MKLLSHAMCPACHEIGTLYVSLCIQIAAEADLDLSPQDPVKNGVRLTKTHPECWDSVPNTLYIECKNEECQGWPKGNAWIRSSWFRANRSIDESLRLAYERNYTS